MHVFRIAKKQFITDLTGEGARLYGGRWNAKGSSVLYTSQSRALATLEYLVHLPLHFVPIDICIAEIHIPDDFSIQIIEASRLPPNWIKYPAIPELAEIGHQWKQEGTYPVLKVPSAVVKNEWNYLINPSHKEASRISITSIENQVFDQRLLY